MQYISGIHALNLPCSLETCGDWHSSALKWEKLYIKDTEKSIFDMYGIELCSCVPYHDGTFYIANTVRACLDLIEDGNFSIAQGMNNDFICNAKYNEEVFRNVSKLKERNGWEKIDAFMLKEYKLDWLNYKKGAKL